jgi:hypothetical protein
MILLPQKVAYRGTISSLRISSVDGTAFIDNLSGATLDLGSSVVNATGTAAIRISSVDGTAFVDTSDATLAAALAANAGKYLVLTDASGRYLKGWIKAAGDGEDLGAELITEWTNDATYPFDTWDSTASTINSAIDAQGSVRAAYKRSILSAGALYKIATNLTGTTVPLYDTGVTGYAGGGALQSVTIWPTGATTAYFTGITGKTSLMFSGPANNAATNFSGTTSCKQATGPSADGATIVSTKGGTTYNFESKDASFTYNAASYTYTIYDRDVTALADGFHQISIYDSTGKLLRGVLKTAGDGEDSTELVLDTGFDDATKWQAGMGWAVNTAGNSKAIGTAGNTSYLSILPAPSAYNESLFWFTATIISTNNSCYSVIGASTSIPLTEGSLSLYRTNVSTGTIYGLRKLADGSCEVSDISIKRITGPSTSGCTIVSAKGGATQNFAYKNASFTYNASSYQIVVRAAR